ncbi:M48 family metallopeptidase [Alphaproteobacteria bacterium]|nr:M48 family metallopeptidase [Alphaproteobacteria bacterium]
MATGLQTHIWNNNFKSMILLGLYPVIIMVLVWGCALVAGYFTSERPKPYEDYYIRQPALTEDAFAFGNSIIYQWWPVILAGVIIWFIIAYFFHATMIRKLSRANPVNRIDEPELYNLLENLCISQGMTMPHLNIIETHARNAFASGIDQKSYAVTVTRGLMNSLTKDELEGVLAHELTHIQNRDVRLLIVTVIFTGMIGFAAQMVWRNLRYGYIYSGRQRGKGGGILIMLGIAAVLWIGYMATLFMRFALSRKREYMADAGAVMMTKNPEAMMRALMRISGKDNIPETTDDIMMMCVENRKRFMGLFATHPPIEHRIRALSEMTGTPIPALPSLPPAPQEERFAPQKKQNPWLSRGRRK